MPSSKARCSSSISLSPRLAVTQPPIPHQHQKVSLIVSDLSGGGAVRAFLLGQVLLDLGYGVEVVGFQFGSALYATPPIGIPVCAIPGQKYPGLLKQIPSLLKKLDGDILYAVKPKPTSFGLGLLRRLQTRKPLLLDMDDWELSWCGGDDWQYKPSPKDLYRDLFKPNGQLKSPDHPQYVKWLEGFVSKADGLTVDTTFLQNRFGGVYVANGKDTDLFSPEGYDAEAARRRLNLSPYRVLMFPGAPRPHKGLEDVLEALEILQEPDLRVVIIGGSPYDDYDDRLMERYSQWLIKVPRLSVEQMPAAVMAAHIVVVPQRDSLTATAQFPLKLSDGMAMGKPIISTRVGDIPTILSDTGYLVDPGSPAQIAEKIREIFSNWPEAEARGKRGRDRCIEHYGLKAMGKGLNAVLQGLK
jgi:glycosyltransferase involved in cell wall biosynthesis